MKVLIVICALLSCAAAASISEQLQAEWAAYKQNFGKAYTTQAEEQQRMLNYAQNKLKVQAHNKRYAAGKERYELGMNQFSDLSYEEFSLRMLQSNDGNDAAARSVDEIYTPVYKDNPRNFDYRQQGIETPVKNQLSCGSCYCFSAVGAVEAAHQLKTGERISLSEQNLLDCTSAPPYDNLGCRGGWKEYGLDFVIARGINTEAAYPYENELKPCRFNPHAVAANLTSYKFIQRHNEAAMLQALVDEGPLLVSVWVTDLFQSYRNGIFFDSTCNLGKTNHAVLLVGYGTDPNGVAFWVIKNSWGYFWGEQGYIRMARNQNSMCEIARTAITVKI
ncbi:zingipain-2-like [Drosophila busckii]|uniref:zingipain-2-like n=1 Tax=Drosophila busckii TaxID=30019 RepID=UPI00083F4B87|nr:zingipain-2-like [Drosophila busckii]